MDFESDLSTKIPNTNGSRIWGTRAWFERQAKSDADSPASYFAHHVNGYQRFRHKTLTLFLQEHIPLSDSYYILDLGCAGGDFLDLVYKTLKSRLAIGLDFITKIIHQGHYRYPDLNFAVASLPDIPLQNASVNIVIASEILYYLTEKEQKRTIQNIHNILIPGGYLFFTSVIGGKYFTQSSARSLITPHFKILTVKYIHSGLYKKLISLPYRVVRFNDLISNGEEPGNARLELYFKKLKFLFHNILGKVLLGSATKVFQKILSSAYLPAACELIGKLLSPRFQSNIIIVAQRNDEESC